MKRLCICIVLLCFILTGCNKKEEYNITERHNEIVEFGETCHYGTTTGLCDLYYRVYNNNTIEIYGSYDANGIVIEHVHGLMFDISESTKQNIINSIMTNEIYTLSENLESGNGSVEESIVLFNEDGSVYKKISCVSPDNLSFVNFGIEFFKNIDIDDFETGVENVVRNINNRLQMERY